MTYDYTLQADKNGNMIVCKGDHERNSYTVIARGSYNDMQERRWLLGRAAHLRTAERLVKCRNLVNEL